MDPDVSWHQRFTTETKHCLQRSTCSTSPKNRKKKHGIVRYFNTQLYSNLMNIPEIWRNHWVLKGSSKSSKNYGMTMQDHTPSPFTWPGPAAARWPGAMLVPSPGRLTGKSQGNQGLSGFSPPKIGSSCNFSLQLWEVCSKKWWSCTCDHVNNIGDLDPTIGPWSEYGKILPTNIGSGKPWWVHMAMGWTFWTGHSEVSWGIQ